MNFAADIKSRVTMRQVVEYYGHRIDRKGFICCPFHSEKTASMKIYGDSFYCFGCGSHGDVIDFVAQEERISFQDACKVINEAFALGLPIGKPMRANEARAAGKRAFEARRKANAAKQAVERAESAFWRAYDRWLTNLSVIEKNTPQSETEPFSEEYGKACNQEAILEWELEQAELALYEAKKEQYNS